MGWDARLSSEQVMAVCLAAAVLGVLALYVYSLGLQPRDMSVQEFQVTPLNEYVSVSGVVESVSLGASFSSMRLCDPLDSQSCVSVRFSNDLLSDIYFISEGDGITARGVVKEYFSRRYLESGNEGDIRKR